MVDAKHTPGPWTVVRAVAGLGPDFGIKADGCDSILSEVFAEFRAKGVVLEAEARANAHLISAAPYLLTALEKVTELLNDPGVGDHEQWKRDCKEWTCHARKAIAKARGE